MDGEIWYRLMVGGSVMLLWGDGEAQSLPTHYDALPRLRASYAHGEEAPTQSMIVSPLAGMVARHPAISAGVGGAEEMKEMLGCYPPSPIATIAPCKVGRTVG